MLFQLNPIQEIQLLLYITAVIIGIQLAIYFFYRYFKIRDDRLPLNKILLAFGMVFSLIIPGTFILAINKIFISDPILKEVFFKLGHSLLLFAITAFLFFINIEELSRVIYLKILKYLIVVNLISILIVILFPNTEFLTILIVVGLTILLLLCILVIQVRLIFTSKGIIKSRLLLIFTGVNLSIISIFLILEVITVIFQPETINILFSVGIFTLIAGFLISMVGVYSFPAFYEFKWKENLLRLFIINQENNMCLYYRDFSEFETKHIGDYKKLFSGGISGIDSILSAITNTRGEKINKIKQVDSFILLEYGSDISSHITYALVVKTDLKSNHYFLKSIKNQFESFYQKLLSELDNIKGSEEQLFGSFDIILKNIMH
ncbi:MAG: hypothetical protein ACFFAH_11605 [Promethearchaeota archaeon]